MHLGTCATILHDHLSLQHSNAARTAHQSAEEALDFDNPEEGLRSCLLMSALNREPRFHLNSHPNPQPSGKRKQGENIAKESAALLSWMRQGQETGTRRAQAASTAVAYSRHPFSPSFSETGCCRQLGLSASAQEEGVATCFYVVQSLSISRAAVGL